MTDRPPTPIATRYTVSALPLDDINARHVSVYIDWRPEDRWVVTDGFQPAQFLDASGVWAYRDHDEMDYEAWRENFHHDFETASRLAQTAVREQVERYGRLLGRAAGGAAA